MANYLELVGLPQITTLPDGRKRVLRRYTVKMPAGSSYHDFGTPASPGTSGIYLAWGTADAEHTGCRLIKQDLGEAAQGAAEQPLVRVYEEIPATGEVLVGNVTIAYDDNARATAQATFLQFTGDIFAPGTVGTDAPPGYSGLVLSGVQATDDGTLRTITRTYLQATSSLTQVGEDTVSRDENGRKTIESIFVQTSTSAYTPGTIGTTAAPSDATCVLVGETKSETTAIRRVVRRFLEAGSDESEIGAATLGLDPDGRQTAERTFIQLASAAYAPGTIGSAATINSVAMALTEVQRTQDGALRRIVRRYLQATISQVQVGGNTVANDENNRRTIEATFIQLVSGTYTLGTIGTETAPSDSGCVLVAESKQENGAVRRITKRYLQLTDTLVQIGSDSVDTEINGLRRRTQQFIGTAAASDPSGAVGTTTHSTDTTLILAGKKVETSGAIKRATLVWIEPGVISKSKSGGPASLPNTLRHSWETWVAVPSMPGVVTSISEGNFQGLKTLVYESLSLSDGTSSPIATLATYRDNVRVTKPGEVHIAKHTFAVGKEVPYLVVTPPTTGTVEMAVTVALTTTAPTSIVPTAYNLDSLSVGVCTKRITESPLGYDEGETITVSVYTDRARVDYDVLRGYYYTDPGSLNNDEITYTYNAQIIRDQDNIIGETLTATETTVITLSGSTDYVAPASGDVYERRVDPALTLADGTQVYRVLTYALP